MIHVWQLHICQQSWSLEREGGTGERDEPAEESRGQTCMSYQGESELCPESPKDFKHDIAWLDLHFRNTTWQLGGCGVRHLGKGPVEERPRWERGRHTSEGTHTEHPLESCSRQLTLLLGLKREDTG